MIIEKEIVMKYSVIFEIDTDENINNIVETIMETLLEDEMVDDVNIISIEEIE